MSDYWQDVGGQNPDRWTGVIDNKCVECGADSGQKCWNKITNTPKHAPCWRRAKVLL